MFILCCSFCFYNYICFGYVLVNINYVNFCKVIIIILLLFLLILKNIGIIDFFTKFVRGGMNS